MSDKEQCNEYETWALWDAPTAQARVAAAVAAERARCLAVAMDVLQRGPGFLASSEFADGYLLAAQEIAAGIRRPEGKE